MWCLSHQRYGQKITPRCAACTAREGWTRPGGIAALESPCAGCNHSLTLGKVMGIGCAVAAVSLVLIGCGGQKTTEGGQEIVTVTVTTEEETTEATTEETTTDEFEDAPEAEDPYEDDTATEDTSSGATSQVALGRAAEDDGLLFRVRKLAKVREIPRSYDRPIRAPGGADLWEAVIQVKNNTSQGADPFCGSGGAILLDIDQRNFEPHQDSISIKGNDAGYCNNIQPGFRATVRMAFTTPRNTEVAGIALWNADFNNESDPVGDTYVVFQLP